MAETEEIKRRDWTGAIIGAMLLPVVLFFIFIGKDEMGRSVAMSLGAIMLAVRIRWDLRKRIWFWGVVVSFLLLHVPLFLLAQWPKGSFYGKGVMLPIALADLVIFLGVVDFIERFIVKSSPLDDVEG